jgi:hypothetical protein
MRAEGTFISGGTYITTVMRGARPGGIGPTDTLRIPRLLFNAAGSVIDTVDWLVQAPPRPSEPLRYLTTSGSRHRVPKPFPDDDLSALFAEGGVTVVRHTAPNAARSTIRVTRQTLRGDTVFSRSYSYLPQGYPDALLDSLAAASLSSSAYAVIDGAVQQMIPDTTRAGQLAMRQAMSLSGNQPPVQTVHIGADASIWLEREDRGGATQRWDLLDARGTAVGRLELPRAMRIGWATQDQVWGILTDEDDVPWLVKLRVSR